MMAGETHTIQALNASNQPVTGLTWTSSDPTVVSLSTDDPPVLTAVAAGHVTITAGSASADVTVSSVSLAPGTVLWSNAVGGASVDYLVPAVPSPGGVADVFAISGNTLYAIIAIWMAARSRSAHCGASRCCWISGARGAATAGKRCLRSR